MLFPERKVTEQLVETWHKAVGELRWEDANSAWALLSREVKWPPMPKDVLDAARRIAKARGPRELATDEAFELGRRAARKFGLGDRRGACNFVNQESGTGRVAKTIKMIGYDRFCSCTDETRDFLYRDFKEAYEGRVEREQEELKLLPVGEQIKTLTGIALGVKALGNK